MRYSLVGRKSDPPSISTRERREAERKRRIPGIPKALHLTPPSHDGRDGDKSGAVAGESHALVNRVAGPFMSSANSSTVAEVAVRSCVHAGKVFFSVCFTGGQGYRGGKRNVARGVGGGGAGGGGGESFTCYYYYEDSLSFFRFVYLSICLFIHFCLLST